MYNADEMGQFMRIAMALMRRRYPNESQRIAICSVLYRDYLKKKTNESKRT